jgi:hypothetical protein
VFGSKPFIVSPSRVCIDDSRTTATGAVTGAVAVEGGQRTSKAESTSRGWCVEVDDDDNDVGDDVVMVAVS